jgi:hypothetical protein
MKFAKIILLVFAVAAIAFVGFRFYDRSHSPVAVVESNKNGLDVKVEYCQPSRKGRVVFDTDGLVRYGKVWRTGANEATIVTINKDVTVADSTLKAGKYSLWTIPNPDKWTIIFNATTDIWGTEYEIHKNKDVLKIDVPSGNSTDLVEKFRIDFDENSNGVSMILRWENTEVAVPIKSK